MIPDPEQMRADYEGSFVYELVSEGEDVLLSELQLPESLDSFGSLWKRETALCDGERMYLLFPSNESTQTVDFSASPMTLRLKQPVSSQEMMVFLPEFLPVLPYGRLPALRNGRKTRENRLWFCFPTQANAIFPPEFMTIDAFAAQV